LTKKDVGITTDDRQSAEVLWYFQEVFTKEIDRDDKATVSAIFGTDGSIQFDVASVYQRLNRLNPDKSAGPDGLHPKLLRECAKNIASEPGNYRPVSLTSVPCKVMEGVIRDRILEQLET